MNVSAYIDSIKRTLAELEAQRRHLDADISDLHRILKRHGEDPNATTQGRGAPVKPKGRKRRSGVASGRGEARSEILAILQRDGTAQPRDIAAERNTSTNAASAALRRMLKEGVVVALGGGRYQLASHDAQASLAIGDAGEAIPRQAGGGGA